MCLHVCAAGCRTSITHWPCIGGRSLDLYTLYTSVIRLGGWEKVGYNTCCWPLPLFDMNSDCHQSETCLKLCSGVIKITHSTCDLLRANFVMQYVSWLKCAYIFSIQKMFSAVCFIKFFQGNWSIAITVDVNFNCVAFPTRCMSASDIDVLITGQFNVVVSQVTDWSTARNV